MMGLHVLRVEACHIELAVVIDLQRFKAAQSLHLAVETAGKESACPAMAWLA